MTAGSSLPLLCCSKPLLLGVIVLQWIIITFLLSQFTHRQAASQSLGVSPTLATAQRGLACAQPRSTLRDSNTGTVEDKKMSVSFQPTTLNKDDDHQQPHSLPGIGVTVLFRNPQWFHLRTSHMLHNAIINLPPNWGLQVFINPSWFWGEARVLSWHPGLRRLLSGGDGTTTTSSNNHTTALSATTSASNNNNNQAQYRGKFLGRHIYVTWLPDHLTKRPAKPKGVLHSPWFWQQIQAERILLFSGNGVFCGNHVLAAPSTAETPVVSSLSSDLLPSQTIWQANGWTEPPTEPYLDYLGTPSRMNNGVGGDGSSHSYRNRTSMLRLLDFAGPDDDSWQGPAEHTWVLRTMQRYNEEVAAKKENAHPFYIATPEQTQAFGGVLGLVSQDAGNKKTTLHHVPYVAAGTFPNLKWEERETLLRHCPELKTIFPSLHEPTCFGAHPKPETCRNSICALRGDLPSSGC